MTPWRRLSPDLSAAMRPQLAATVREVADALTEATPTLAEVENSKVERDVLTAVTVALERFLELVGTDEPALPPRSREVFTGLGAAEARENHGPEALLATFRLAARVMLRKACAALAEVRPVDTAELIDLSDAIHAYVDELTAASTDGFALQLREQAGEGDRRRRQLAELLLRGSAPASVVAAAAAGIGWRALDAVVPVVLPLEQARDARFRYGVDGVVVERVRDAVLLLRAGPRAARSQLTDALHGRGAVVGPALEWSLVPEGVRLAELAAGLVGPDRLTGPDQAPVFADDHLATLALRGEPGALAALSTHRLAPLAAVRATQRERLLETLHSWLMHWGSRADVSADLFVHPQTVSYRLKHLRELLGADLDNPATRFELLLVLASPGLAAGAPQPAP
ncbi:helix-turn-helix domain-containing protein [Actinoplanes sp. NPDC051470]|uniref:PucR family transcriptional regulator n=1 Tax=Actinoplanes sp. NPDC051470 TaxID=3157224 RepID=UPI0034468454